MSSPTRFHKFSGIVKESLLILWKPQKYFNNVAASTTLFIDWRNADS